MPKKPTKKKRASAPKKTKAARPKAGKPKAARPKAEPGRAALEQALQDTLEGSPVARRERKP